MRRLTVIVAILISRFAIADGEPCPLQELADYPYADLHCQFLLGTTAYRAEFYEVAAAHWHRVASSPIDSEDVKMLKAEALGTLSYLRYHGLGIERDMHRAVTDWTAAARNGAVEARMQLGYAYSDSNFDGNDPLLALAWYESLRLSYPDPAILDDTDQAVYEIAVNGIAELEERLSDSEIDRAREEARTLVWTR